MTQSSNEGRWRSRVKRLLTELAIFAGLAAATLAIWHWISPSSSPIAYYFPANTLPALPRSERPPTLDPALFTGQVAEGYRVAREHPELLEQMPCYCGCYGTHGHQNNLDCFRDRHGETCPMCLAIALRAERLAKDGYSAAEIKKKIDRWYAPRAP